MLKKYLSIFLVFLICMAVFAGCDSGNNSADSDTAASPSASVADTVPSDEAEELNVITASDDSFDDLYTVGEYEYDLDGDGADDYVGLCTDAEVGKDGKIMLNDGQNWVLYAEVSGETYVLFEQYINNGGAYFEVADYYQSDGTAVPNINLTISTGASLKLLGFSYLSEENGFVCRELYNSGDYSDGGINRVYTMYEGI